MTTTTPIKIISTTLLLLLLSCKSYFNPPVVSQKARLAELTPATKNLTNLPPPKARIVVGVYNFKDQTGQYKNTKEVSSFSTAVTQGATTILIRALEESKWFKLLERENLGNLLNERNIIRTTREEYAGSHKNASQKLSPLLFAGILLEGGIISYDTNILTGGIGARYLGIGGSTQYRQDRITVYLRAISTSTGEILKTVNISKTILSQGVDVGIFRYVNFKKLLEAETGFTKNEPAQMAVQEAIEKAVEALILEGIQDGLWATKEGKEKDKEIADAYLEEQELENSLKLHKKLPIKRENQHSISGFVGAALIDGDYSSRLADFSSELTYQYRFRNGLGIGADIQFLKFNSTPEVKHWWLASSLNIQYNFMPYNKLSPLIYGGPGSISFVDTPKGTSLDQWDTFFKLKLGLGLEYTINEHFSAILKTDWNYIFSDKIDDQQQGKRDDLYYNFGLGLNYRFKSKNK